MTFTRAFVFLLTLSVTTPCASADAGPLGPDANSVLSLLTTPTKYEPYSGRRLYDQGEVIEGLAMLGDAATPVLLQALTSDLPEARHNATRLLERFGDARALEPLKQAFLLEPDPGGRTIMARVMRRLFPSHTAGLLLDSLRVDPAPSVYDPRIQELVNLRETGVVPLLKASSAGQTPAEPESPEAYVVLCRVEAGDAEAIPALIDLHRRSPTRPTGSRYWSSERAMTALVAAGDDRVIPLLIRELRTPTAGREAGRLPHGSNAYGSRLVPPLLDAIAPGNADLLAAVADALNGLRRGPDGTAPVTEHTDAYGEALLDATYAVAPYRQRNADARLRTSIAEALACLGAPGRQYLRRAARTAHAHREALFALASYGDIETMRELAALATGPAYPHTSAAVDAFSRVAWLWEAESQPVWEALVQGPDIEMAGRCVAYVERYRPKNSADLLTRFMDTDDASLLAAARRAWARAVDGEDPPSYESLEILVATDGRAYEYDDDIRMTVEITNAGERPVTIDTFPFDQTKYIPSWLNLELTLPNGERRRYPDRRYGPDLAPSGDTNRVLHQGQSVATAIDVRRHDRYPQPGTHVATVAFGTPLHFMYATPPSGLPELVRANAVTFEVAQPSDTTVREMVDSLSLAGLSDEGDADIRDICDRLGELREPSAIAALVRLARGAPTADTPKVPEGVTRAARRALTRYADPALTPLWIELLGKDAELAIAQLSKSGDARAIGPLRRLAFGSYRTVMPDGRRMFNPQGLDAALALRGLGDDDALTFLRWEARRGMDAHDMRTWQQAVGFALQAMSDAELPTALRHEHPGVRYAALGPAERRGRVDVMAAALSDVDRRVRKRAVDALAGPYRTLDATPAKTAAREQALTGALDDAELTIRRAAALALASAGNRAAEALLRRDLVSADHATRMRARAALGALRRSR